jgi:hypothetical protein
VSVEDAECSERTASSKTTGKVGKNLRIVAEESMSWQTPMGSIMDGANRS